MYRHLQARRDNPNDWPENIRAIVTEYRPSVLACAECCERYEARKKVVA